MIKSISYNVLLIWLSALSTLAFQDQLLLELNRSEARTMSHEESLEYQKKAISEQSGLPIEDVHEFMDFQEAFGSYAESLYDLYPDRISYIRMEPMPERYGLIQFIGKAPAEAFQKMGAIHQLGGEVILFEDGEFTYEQNVARAELAAEVLNDMGFQNHATYFDSLSEKIKLEITADSQKKTPSLLEIADLLQQKLDKVSAKSGQNLGSVIIEDLEMEMVDYSGVFTGNYPGGREISSTSTGAACTAAFTIIKPGGTKGFMTAGHCPSMNRIHSGGSGKLSTQTQADWFNNTHNRDLEWHTVNGHQALKSFQSSSCCRTTNNGWKPTSGMAGGTVCRYGMVSNYTSCNHTVLQTGFSITANGVTITKLALASNNTATNGDSGGPWFVGGQAWGIMSGFYGGNSFFTQIESALSKIGADIYD